MMENNFNRRDFLKVLGWGGAAVALSACGNTSVEDGTEFVTSHATAAMPEYAIPGVYVHYNSTCAQCDGGCSIFGRLREGRVLKLEGNPESPINKGKICGLGQAALQAHYNPDRITHPMLRKGDQGETITWDQAFALIKDKLAGVDGGEVAFLTGATSGHTGALLENYMGALGSAKHYAYEPITPSVVRAANKKSYGVEMPRLHIDKARVVLSFGADFLGAWVSPVNFTQQYAKFRKGSDGMRGVLVQVESKMTLTGANADRWLCIRPGTEGIYALGLINALGAKGFKVPAAAAAIAKDYTAELVVQETGVSAEHTEKLVAVLMQRTPSLVLVGTAAEGYAHGSQNAAAITLLNHVLGNVGKTMVYPASVPFPQIEPKVGGRYALHALSDEMKQGKVKVLFTCGSNPVFTSNPSVEFKENLQKVPFKVVLTHYRDETAMEADLVLPLDSVLEDWGSSVPEYMAETAQINIQQALSERLYPETRGVGDILLALLKQRRPAEYDKYEDFYAYLRNAMVTNKVALGADSGTSDDIFWRDTLSRGIIKLPATTAKVSGKLTAIPSVAKLTLPGAFAVDEAYPFHLIPYTSAHVRDGRHANIPWLQESPDPLTTIVWDSWIEIHPTTAIKLGVVEGDIVEVASRSGTIKVMVYVFKGIHPDAVSIPMGYGHEAMGRYAKNVGSNVFKILDSIFDRETGELALHETRVKVTRTGQKVKIVKDEGPYGGGQAGKRIALRKTTDKVNLSKEI
ncbi:MAG: molybdopterin-dependent oxidoreductase [Candidatus Nitrotoga sp.]